MRVSSFVSTFLLLAIPGSTIHARTIRVPSEEPTIQAGIDAADHGDVVLVADGTYTGYGNYDIDFLGKSLVVKSENGPEMTIIAVHTQNDQEMIKPCQLHQDWLDKEAEGGLS